MDSLAPGAIGILDLHVERARLRAVRSIARTGGKIDDVESLDRKIAAVDRVLAATPAPDRGLASLLGLHPDEMDLLLAVTAATIDPVLTHA